MKEIKPEHNTTINNPINDLTEVRNSPLEGFGIFAKVFIPKGTIWWRAAPNDILLIKREQFLTFEDSKHSPLIESLRHCILLYSFYNKDYDALVFCLDNARYVNHSYTPNSENEPGENHFSSISLRDINPGEELLEDYSVYELCPWADIHEAFLVNKHSEE